VSHLRSAGVALFPDVQQKHVREEENYPSSLPLHQDGTALERNVESFRTLGRRQLVEQQQ
jgi:hypothetical protein